MPRDDRHDPYAYGAFNLTTDDDHLVYFFEVFTGDNRKSVLAVPESQTADHKVRGCNRSATSRRFCT